MPFYQVSEIEPFELLPGLRIRAPFGQNLMLSYLEFDRDAVVPFHSHPHEQGGIVLQGKVELILMRVQVETNNPRPSRKATQAFPVRSQPGQSLVHLPDDGSQMIKNP